MSKLPWRESASLILASGNQPLRILLLQRIGGGAFGKSKVFPGGVLDSTDLSPRWVNLFPDYLELFDRLRIPDHAERPLIFTGKDGELPREVGLRICAIRETYEETGILLARWKSSSEKLKPNGLEQWRKEVHQNGHRFFDMCKELNIVPDVTALKLWSDWLTPIDVPGKRFDTAFFIAESEHAQSVEINNSEMIHSEWITPSTALLNLAIGKSMMPPPQVYEFSRLLGFHSVDDLMTFAVAREKFGCPLMFPVRIRCSDGIITLMPGDDAYPSLPDTNAKNPPLKADATMKELRNLAKNLHRIEGDLSSNNINGFYCNIDFSPKHCNPVQFFSDQIVLMKTESD